MWTELKKTISALIAAVFVIALSAGFAGAETDSDTTKKNTHFWIMFDKPQDTLPQVKTLLKELNDKLLRNVKVCLAEGEYPVVIPGGQDRSEAEAGKRRLEKTYADQTLNVVAIEKNRCFEPIHFFPHDSDVLNTAVQEIPPPPEKKRAIHLEVPVPEKQDTDSGYSQIMSDPVRVSPDITVQVPLSNLDVNRITCMGGAPVKDVVYSQEKGVTTKINGSNVFLKLQKHQDPATMKVKTVREPIDLYVVCGHDQAVYTIIGTPKKIPAQWIQLESKANGIRKTMSLFKGIPFEKKLLEIMKQAYFGEYHDYYQVDVKNESIAIEGLEWLNIRLIRDIAIDGEGLQVRVFELRIQESAAFEEKKVMESFFILPEIAENPVGIALSGLTLRKTEKTNLFVIGGKTSQHTENLEIVKK